MNALSRDQFRWDPGLLAIPVAFWLWLALACAPEWSASENDAIGWILLPLSAYFLAKRLAATLPDTSPPGPLAKGFAWGVLTLAALCILPVELARQAPIYWRVFLWAVFALVVMATLASALLAGGWSILRAVIFPLIFLGSAVPWPTFFEQAVTINLMLKTSALFGDILPLLGVPAHIEGTVIVLPTCAVGINEACSGVRSLQSAIIIGLAAGEWFELRSPGRIAVLIWSLALALLLNAGRTLGLTIAGLHGGESAISAWHDPLGWAALLSLAGGIFLGARLFSAYAANPGASGGEAISSGFPARIGRLHPAPALLFALALIAFIAPHIWYFAHEIHSPVREAILRVNRLPAIQVSPLPEALERNLAPTKGELVRLALPDAEPVHGYHFFWDASRRNSRQLYHQPEVCMPSGGWRLAGSEYDVKTDLDGMTISWRAAPYERDGQLGLLLWTAWIDGVPMQSARPHGASIQSNTLLQFIRNGRRRFTYEVAAVFVASQGTNQTLTRATSAAQFIFSARR